jgi:hypothetical protein
VSLIIRPPVSPQRKPKDLFAAQSSPGIDHRTTEMLSDGKHGQHGLPAAIGARPHPRQKTRSPSSHKTWKLLSPLAPNREDGFNCRPPASSRWPLSG